MPRPETKLCTLTIDGLEVEAPAGAMLVDAAKYGDIEIPVFCYEPKLGQPVGACRMCLVEIEGIPKLQAGCATPVRDGMVVHTRSERAEQAQRAVVEFLLINHPLDCPVCDKGGECPLQDITFGWGPGRSRFIEPKRHFKKPLELSPLIAIDRERCILCYRCVRFSQEVSEDYQLVFLERGEHTYVGTHDGHPYVAPFSGNIIELCPVGALTSQPYRFRARPWDIEGSGSLCTLCPSQCNVTYTVRDDRVLRVLARQHDGVDDGWLCDKGRFAYQAVHSDERVTEPLVREGGVLRPATWEDAIARAGAALASAHGSVAALAGGQTTNEEALLVSRLLRDGLESPHLDSAPYGSVPAALRRALAAPALQASVVDIEFAHTVLVLDCEPIDDAPIIDLRIRKGVRRNGVRLAVASARPSALDPNARAVARFAPGGGPAFAQALATALGGAGDLAALARAAGAQESDVSAVAELLGAGEDVVVVWGERLLGSARAARALLNLAAALHLGAAAGAGLLELPTSTNGRGLREAGFLPDAGPGYGALGGAAGKGAGAIADALGAGELSTLWLLHVDPVRSWPAAGRWRRALAAATDVIAHTDFLTPALAEHATVVFPADAGGVQQEGTMTHPDGRVQRLRPAIGRARGGRATWQVIANLASRAGHDLGVLTGAAASRELFEAVPFYAGLTLEELGGRGLRWPERPAAGALAAGDAGPFELDAPPAAVPANGSLRLGTFRSIWASPEVEAAPALSFLAATQRAELCPADAERLGLAHGDAVEVGVNGTSVRASVHLRAAVPPGSVFLETGTARENANVLDGPLVEVRPGAGGSA